MIYDGVPLDLPAGKVAFSHSHVKDIITGKSGDESIEWLDKLGELPWGQLKLNCPERYEDAGKIFSLYHMDYQVCNGGIFQYFDNRYHEERDPYSENDVMRYDISVQKEYFSECVEFARAIYPHRSEENEALAKACDAFQTLSYEEDVPYEETIESGEDEYIYDDDLGEEVPNPDWFEPYEETSYENVISGCNNFDDIFDNAYEYLEEILELQAQLCCKRLVQDLQRNVTLQPEVAASLKEILPTEAFRKASLTDQIQAADAKLPAKDNAPSPALTPESPVL